MNHPSSAAISSDLLPALWGDPAPRHFDTRIAWWIKALAVAVATILAILFLDGRIASWTLATHPIPDLADPQAAHNDLARELMMLEQWGPWTCSVLVITAVALIDKAGRRRALAITLGCIITVLATYLFKDLFGRLRPYMFRADEWSQLIPGTIWAGPAKGFTGGGHWTSFPSAHTSSAFALSAGLAWFYPRGRALFMALATITAAQRVLHSAHYLSDVIAGMGLAVFLMRWTLHAKLAGRLIAAMPEELRLWFMRDAA